MDILYNDYLTAFQVMIKPIGPVCNLDCKYCYYLEKENIYQGRKDFKMPMEILEPFIKQHIESQNVPLIQFVWQGGEPTLLGKDYYLEAIKVQQKYAGNKRIENVFQTNGTLLDDDWCRFMREHNFLVGISIDGPQHLHDHYRKTKAQQPTFDKVMRGIELCKKHKVQFNTLTVVNDYNQHYPLEVYRFLKRIGSGYMQFIPIVERIADDMSDTPLALVSPDYKKAAKVSDWSVDPLQYGEFLNAIFDDWVRTDVGRFYVQIFDVTLANTVRTNPGLCVFGETCGDATAIEHNGDLYSCDHFVYPENLLGNIKDSSLLQMIKSKKQIQFGLNKRDSLPQQCRDCEVYDLCHGGCPKNRIAVTDKGEPGLNYLCEGYKVFFNHVRPAMDFMAGELEKKKPPANVMRWVREQQAEKAQKAIAERKAQKQRKHGKQLVSKPIGKNDPCPCGSGKKYKDCCRNKTKK